MHATSNNTHTPSAKTHRFLLEDLWTHNFEVEDFFVLLNEAPGLLIQWFIGCKVHENMTSTISKSFSFMLSTCSTNFHQLYMGPLVPPSNLRHRHGPERLRGTAHGLAANCAAPGGGVHPKRPGSRGEAATAGHSHRTSESWVRVVDHPTKKSCG